MDLLQQVHVSPVLRAPDLDAGLLGGGVCVCVSYWGRIPSIDLLAMLLLLQPRIRLAFWAAHAHWWVI